MNAPLALFDPSYLLDSKTFLSLGSEPVDGFSNEN